MKIVIKFSRKNHFIKIIALNSLNFFTLLNSSLKQIAQKLWRSLQTEKESLERKKPKSQFHISENFASREQLNLESYSMRRIIVGRSINKNAVRSWYRSTAFSNEFQSSWSREFECKGSFLKQTNEAQGEAASVSSSTSLFGCSRQYWFHSGRAFLLWSFPCFSFQMKEVLVK